MKDRASQLTHSLTVQVLLIAIASRFMLMAMNWYTFKIFPTFQRGYPKLFDELIHQDHPLAGWSRWDAAHYALVAFEGYEGPAGEPVQTRGFFPLYPMLTRAFAWMMPGEASRSDVALAGVIVANICFLAMVVILAKMIAARFDRETALTATTLLIVSPFAFFFNAGYSESLFMLGVVTAFWFAYRQQWIGASVAISLTSATRLFGLALIPCILWIAWKQRAQIRDLVMIPAVGAMGTIAYVIWTWIRYDDALAYWNAQSTFWGDWHDRVGAYIDILRHEPMEMLRSPENFVILLNLAMAVLVLATLPWVWKRVEPGLALFTTIIAVFHSLYTWHSLGRYLLAAIGVYIVWALWLNRKGWDEGLRTAVFVASTTVLTTLNLMFAHGFWIV